MARSVPESHPEVQEGLDLPSLDSRLGSIIEAVEAEAVPDALIEHALQLQARLDLHRQRRRPN